MSKSGCSGNEAAGQCEDERNIFGHRANPKMAKTSPVTSQLIPGLPEDLAQRCLARVPCACQKRLVNVCKAWASCFRSHQFFALRSRLSLSESFLAAVTEASLEHGVPSVRLFDIKQLMKLGRHKPVAVFDFPWEQAGYSFLTRFRCSVVGHDLFILGGQHYGGSATNSGGTSTTCEYTYPTYPGCAIVSKDVWRFNFISRKWTSAAPMHSARRNFASAVIDGKIYVAGGVYYVGGGIYGAGGSQTSNRQHSITWNILDSAEMYDCEHDQWHILPRLEKARTLCLGSVVLEDRFYVIGGVKDHVDRSAEIFDIRKGAWETVENMWPDDCRNRTFVVSDHILYAVNDMTIKSYDEKCNYWNDIMAMPVTRIPRVCCSFGRLTFVQLTCFPFCQNLLWIKRMWGEWSKEYLPNVTANLCGHLEICGNDEAQSLRYGMKPCFIPQKPCFVVDLGVVSI